MSITPEQMIQVGKLLHPNWAFRIIGLERPWAFNKIGDPGDWFPYDVLTPAECYAMVRWLWDHEQDLFPAPVDAEALANLVLAIGGES